MTHRERAVRALGRKPVDKPAVEFYYSPVGYYEHGEKLNDLYERCPGDFAPFARQPVPVLPPEVFDADGRYHEFVEDAWGVLWEYRVYGIMGHAARYPINSDGDAYTRYAAGIAAQKKDWITRQGIGFSVIERLSGLMGFDNLLIALADDGPEINSLLDRLADYYLPHVHAAIHAGADYLSFGDDFGTQENLIMSLDLFRHALLPRFARLMAPAKEAGVHIHFHSCGQVGALLPLLREIGVCSIWPQLPLYDMRELKYTLDSLGMSIALHTDRANTMTHGTPQEVRELVGLENEIFKPRDGGAWFYVECDTGFPFENVRALVESVNEV